MFTHKATYTLHLCLFFIVPQSRVHPLSIYITMLMCFCAPNIFCGGARMERQQETHNHTHKRQNREREKASKKPGTILVLLISLTRNSVSSRTISKCVFLLRLSSPPIAFLVIAPAMIIRFPCYIASGTAHTQTKHKKDKNKEEGTWSHYEWKMKEHGEAKTCAE